MKNACFGGFCEEIVSWKCERRLWNKVEAGIEDMRAKETFVFPVWSFEMFKMLKEHSGD